MAEMGHKISVKIHTGNSYETPNSAEQSYAI